MFYFVLSLTNMCPLFSNFLSKAWTLRKSCSGRAGWREKKRRTIKAQWWVHKEGYNCAECWQEKLNQTSWSCSPCVSSLSSELGEHRLPTVSHYGPTGPWLKIIKTGKKKKLSCFTSHNHFHRRLHFGKKYCSKHGCSLWQEVFPVILIKFWFGLSRVRESGWVSLNGTKPENSFINWTCVYLMFHVNKTTTLSLVWEGHQCIALVYACDSSMSAHWALK